MKAPNFLQALRAKGYSTREASRILQDLQAIATETLQSGAKFIIPEVVKIERVATPERTFRNPKTQEPITRPAGFKAKASPLSAAAAAAAQA